MVSKKVLQSCLICALVALFSLHIIAAEEKPLAKFSKILPEKVESFRKTEADGITKDINKSSSADINITSSFYRIYKSPILGSTMASLDVRIIQTESEYDAYSLFSIDNANPAPTATYKPTRCEFGVACFKLDGFYLAFVKGNVIVRISITDPSMTVKPVSQKEAEMIMEARIKTIETLAKAVSDNLTSSQEDIPPIIKHLPDWENVQGRVSYTRNYKALKNVLGFSSGSLLDVMPVEENVESVVGKYDNAKLVIIEHGTPQIASDADTRIQQKINELKSQNQPVPSAHKRVGNYSVFVFDAPDEATANNLISQIDYGKTVQWLYGDPFENDRANRRYLLVAGGVIVTVLKTAGIALLLCFGIGGGFGYFVFVRRRRQQATSTAFSDAGGMMRLNLDDMTSQTDPARLLEK